MTSRTKYVISGMVVGICLVLIGYGFNNIIRTQNTDGIMGVGFLYGGVIIGVISCGFYYYFRRVNKEGVDSDKERQKVEVETLAKFGQSKSKKKK